MKRRVAFYIIVALIIPTGFWVGSLLLVRPLQPIIAGGEAQPIIAGEEAPFIAHIRKRAQPATGAASSQEGLVSVVYARREDRSYARIISAEGEIEPLREIADVPHHRFITLDPSTKSKLTYIYSVAGFQKLLNTMDSENCPAALQGTPAPEFRSRYSRAVVHVADETALDSTQKVQDELWRVPSLACFAVKEVATRSDGAKIESEVTSLVEGDPPRELFDIPADYEERSPTQVESLHLEKYKAPFFGETAAAGLDRTYQRLKLLDEK